MKPIRTSKTLDELESLALEGLRKSAGNIVEGATITLDEDGVWCVGAKVHGDSDAVAVTRAIKEVEADLKKRYTIATDT